MTLRILASSAAFILLVIVSRGTASASDIFTTIQKWYQRGQVVSKEMLPGHRYRSFSMSAPTMEPTIPKGATLLDDMTAYDRTSPARGDIIVFDPPIVSENPWIKRIIALPGDKLEIRHSQIFVNGKRYLLPKGSRSPNYDLVIASKTIYVDGSTDLRNDGQNVPPASFFQSADRLPDGCYFVMGDAANNSLDSHLFGCVQRVGKIWGGPMKGKPASPFGKITHIFPQMK